MIADPEYREIDLSDGPAFTRYVLVLDTVSGQIVRAAHDEPIPPRCFKVLRVRDATSQYRYTPYRPNGSLKARFWSLGRWHDQAHVRHRNDRHGGAR